MTLPSSYEQDFETFTAPARQAEETIVSTYTVTPDIVDEHPGANSGDQVGVTTSGNKIYLGDPNKPPVLPEGYTYDNGYIRNKNGDQIASVRNGVIRDLSNGQIIGRSSFGAGDKVSTFEASKSNTVIDMAKLEKNQQAIIKDLRNSGYSNKYDSDGNAIDKFSDDPEIFNLSGAVKDGYDVKKLQQIFGKDKVDETGESYTTTTTKKADTNPELDKFTADDKLYLYIAYRSGFTSLSDYKGYNVTQDDINRMATIDKSEAILNDKGYFTRYASYPKYDSNGKLVGTNLTAGTWNDKDKPRAFSLVAVIADKDPEAIAAARNIYSQKDFDDAQKWIDKNWGTTDKSVAVKSGKEEYSPTAVNLAKWWRGVTPWDEDKGETFGQSFAGFVLTASARMKLTTNPTKATTIARTKPNPITWVTLAAVLTAQYCLSKLEAQKIAKSAVTSYKQTNGKPMTTDDVYVTAPGNQIYTLTQMRQIDAALPKDLSKTDNKNITLTVNAAKTLDIPAYPARLPTGADKIDQKTYPALKTEKPMQTTVPLTKQKPMVTVNEKVRNVDNLGYYPNIKRPYVYIPGVGNVPVQPQNAADRALQGKRKAEDFIISSSTAFAPAKAASRTADAVRLEALRQEVNAMSDTMADIEAYLQENESDTETSRVYDRMKSAYLAKVKEYETAKMAYVTPGNATATTAALNLAIAQATKAYNSALASGKTVAQAKVAAQIAAKSTVLSKIKPVVASRVATNVKTNVNTNALTRSLTRTAVREATSTAEATATATAAATTTKEMTAEAAATNTATATRIRRKKPTTDSDTSNPTENNPNGAVAWPQGELQGKTVWNEIEYPYNKVTTTVGRKPKGAVIVSPKKSPKINVRVTREGTIPTRTIDMGVQDIVVKQTAPKRVRISFRPDPKQSTTSQLRIGQPKSAFKSQKVGKIYHTKINGSTMLSRRPLGKKRR